MSCKDIQIAGVHAGKRHGDAFKCRKWVSPPDADHGEVTNLKKRMKDKKLRYKR